MAPARRFEGIPDEIHKLLDANMDEAPARRKAREAFKDIQLGIDHCLLKLPHEGLKMEELYEKNSRGVEIFTKSWLPKNVPLKGVICFCHGYGDTCTFYIEGIARKLASCGYGVFAMDYPGFGLSEGLHGYIPDFDVIIDDVIEHYSKVKENLEFQSLPSFLFGQSMGGAVALKIHLKQPKAWDGAILTAPMCKIAEEMVLPWAVRKLIKGFANILPKAKLVPHANLADKAYGNIVKKKLAKYNVIAYTDKLRLGTAIQIHKIITDIGPRLAEVSLSLLIMHGEDDVVTDPFMSRDLYDKACSTDKKLILYKDANHCLLDGSPDEMIFRVLGDIISWLDEHCSQKLEVK